MPSLVKRSNGVYYQITFLNGRRIWRSTGARTKSEAREIIRENVERADRKPDLRVSEFAIHFLPYAQTNFAPTTVELYQAATKNFVRHLGDHLLRSYTPPDLERLKTLRVAEVSPVRVNLEFRTVKAFFQTAVRWGFLEKNPFQGVKQIRIPPRRPTYLTKKEFARLMEVIDLPWLKNLVQFAVYRFSCLRERLPTQTSRFRHHHLP